MTDGISCTIHRSFDRNFSCQKVAFGEVLATDLTKCHAENPQIVVVGGFSLASGEIFGSNLTKCPKIGQKPAEITPPFQRLTCNGGLNS